MALFDFRRPRADPPQTLELPIFALHSVLFPEGVLPLKVFEQRYMAMISECLKAQRPFGVCLITEGAEVGAPALTHAVGTMARIASWDMVQPGLLHIVARGEGRFRVLERRADPQGVVRARVELLPPEPSLPVPDTLQGLLPLLRAIAADAGAERIAEPHRFDDAAWVGHRFAEVLPIPLIARQKLLELDDPVSRLEIIHKYLAQRGLVS